MVVPAEEPFGDAVFHYISRVDSGGEAEYNDGHY